MWRIILLATVSMGSFDEEMGLISVHKALQPRMFTTFSFISTYKRKKKEPKKEGRTKGRNRIIGEWIWGLKKLKKPGLSGCRISGKISIYHPFILVITLVTLFLFSPATLPSPSRSVVACNRQLPSCLLPLFLNESCAKPFL